MALDPALPGEGRRHDIDPEMTLAAGPVAGVALVEMGLVDHPKAVRAESLGQLPCDEVVGSHRPALPMPGCRRQRGCAETSEKHLSSLRPVPSGPHNRRP